jgi:hypothetical protein
MVFGRHRITALGLFSPANEKKRADLVNNPDFTFSRWRSQLIRTIVRYACDTVRQLAFLAVFTTLVITACPLATLAQGLQGYWPLDENVGTTTTDASGNGSNGSITGPVTWTTGRVGSALNFNGTDGVVNAGTNPAIANLPAITVSAWIRPTGTGETGYGRILQKGNGTTSAVGFWLNLTSNSGVQFSSYFSSASVQRTTTGSNINLTGVWQHVVATWDGTTSGGGIHIYRNGVELAYAATVNGTGSRVDDSASILWIGNNNSGARTFAGTLDDIRIYNRVLTSQEITDLYNTAAPPPPADTTAPTVSITAPVNGTIVSGMTTVSANASDNIGVAGVQFKLDGNNLGAEDTTAPYSIQWDTAAASNASHTLTAVARDVAENSTTSASVTVTVSNTVADPSSNLRGAWAFDEGAGTSTADGSGNGSTGNIIGSVAWTTGKSGAALAFNGTDGVVNAGARPALANMPAMTVSAWIKPTGTGETGYGRIVQKGNGTMTSVGFWMNMSNTGGLQFSVYMTPASVQRYTAGSIINMTGIWQHVVATWDGTTNGSGIHIYRNGAEVAYGTTINGSGSRVDDSASTLWIGNNDSGARTFAGAMDDVRIYNRALTAQEITDLYNSAGPPPPPPTDTTAPTVAITAPADSATVSGSTTISANAGDNVGVTGVQFKLDGNNFGAEDTSAPYSIAWDTTAASNASHTLAAVARDAAGNTTTSASVSVTVNNVIGDPSSNLRAYWTLDEGSGTTVVDSSGYGSTGTLTGPVSWTAGRVGPAALMFNGTDGAVNSGINPVLANLPSMTISAWILPNGSGETGWGRIIQKGTSSSTVHPPGFWFNLTPDAGLEFSNFNATTNLNRATGTVITMGAWQHVVVTWDGSNSAAGIHMYRNGIEYPYVRNIDGVGARGDDSAGNLWIGNASLMSRTFNGIIDDPRIYNRVLTPAEVMNLFTTTPPPPADNTPPSVGLTAPSNGTTVAGTVTVSANASDNIGVTGVQFKLDGNNLGAEVTTAPYSFSWNTATALDGTHVLTAVARDGSANTTLSDSISVTVNNAVPDLSANLRASWPMEEGSGTTTADATGNGSNGTISGPVTWSVGRAGNSALRFNGISGIVTAGTSPAVANLPALTFSAWIFPTGTGAGGYGRILHKGAPQVGGYWWNLTSGIGLQLSVDYSGTDLQRSAAAGNLTLNTWQFVTVTWDGTSNGTGIHLYRNGSELTYGSTTNGTGSRIDDSAGILRIGNNDTMARAFAGVIDDVRIYNRVLTQAEITNLYSSYPIAGDLTPPAVAITQPSAGSTVSDTVTIAADASDGSGVAGVQFRLDGVNLGAEVMAPPYSRSWTTSSLANGSHTLTAVARDIFGNTATSDPVTVTVANFPAISGQWTGPFSWPLVAIHAMLMHTGKVLMWDNSQAIAPRIWDPTANTFETLPLPPTDLFCAGHVALSDGRIFIPGGWAGDYIGEKTSYVFDPVTKSLTKTADMSQGRWYPTATVLPDGRVLSTSGTTTCSTCWNDTPEVYNPATNVWTQLTGATLHMGYAYPFMFVMADGRVLNAGSVEGAIPTRVLDVNTQSWTMVDPRILDGGSAAMYAPGKFIKTGTATAPRFADLPAAPTTYLLDMNQPAPAWRQTAPMAYPRSYHQLVPLPDGSVLVVGGGKETSGWDVSQAVYAAELWSPQTEVWTTLSSAQIPRMYHTSAFLLPDGRVAVMGSGRNPYGPAPNQTNAEIFSPPYLFKGPRPTLSSVPGGLVTYGSSFFVGTPDAGTVQSITLIKPAAVTHSFNQEERIVPLTFTPTAGGFTADAPANANLAPPGYYMLFIVNNNGVPSVAQFVQIGQP